MSIQSIFEYISNNALNCILLIVCLAANVIFLHSLLVKVERKNMQVISLFFLTAIYVTIYINNVHYLIVYNYLVTIMSIAAVFSFIELGTYQTSGESDYLFFEAYFAILCIIGSGLANFNFFGIIEGYNFANSEPILTKVVTLILYVTIYISFKDVTVTKKMNKP